MNNQELKEKCRSVIYDYEVWSYTECREIATALLILLDEPKETLDEMFSMICKIANKLGVDTEWDI